MTPMIVWVRVVPRHRLPSVRLRPRLHLTVVFAYPVRANLGCLRLLAVWIYALECRVSNTHQGLADIIKTVAGVVDIRRRAEDGVIVSHHQSVQTVHLVVDGHVVQALAGAGNPLGFGQQLAAVVGEHETVANGRE